MSQNVNMKEKFNVIWCTYVFLCNVAYFFSFLQKWSFSWTFQINIFSVKVKFKLCWENLHIINSLVLFVWNASFQTCPLFLLLFCSYMRNFQKMFYAEFTNRHNIYAIKIMYTEHFANIYCVFCGIIYI